MCQGCPNVPTPSFSQIQPSSLFPSHRKLCQGQVPATFKLARSCFLLHVSTIASPHSSPLFLFVFFSSQGFQVTHLVLLFLYPFSSLVRSLSCCVLTLGCQSPLIPFPGKGSQNPPKCLRCLWLLVLVLRLITF